MCVCVGEPTKRFRGPSSKVPKQYLDQYQKLEDLIHINNGTSFF